MRTMEPATILYDGHCPLCNGWVRWVLAHDPAGRFHFAPIQSAWAADRLRRRGLDPEGLSTIVLVRGQETLIRSDAPLAVWAELPGPWRLLRFGRFVPRAVRDRFYDLVARNRFRWSRPLDVCPSPPEEFRERFRF